MTGLIMLTAMAVGASAQISLSAARASSSPSRAAASAPDSVATSVLVALGFWLLGGVVLRVGGILLVAVGLLSTAATGSPSAALVALLGAAAQRCHRAVRDHDAAVAAAERSVTELTATWPPVASATRQVGSPW